MEQVQLLDEHGVPSGLCEKYKAHQLGLLYAAFSVFVFDEARRVLLQRRSLRKYHSGGLWSNTCCSHPAGSDAIGIVSQAQNRLAQEMGFSCPLTELFSFRYRAYLPSGLIEHEEDMVLSGCYSGAVLPNPVEVMEYRWIKPEQLLADLSCNPATYTPWLCRCFPRVMSCLDARPIRADVKTP